MTKTGYSALGIKDHNYQRFLTLQRKEQARLDKKLSQDDLFSLLLDKYCT